MAQRNFCNGCDREVVDGQERGIRQDRPRSDNGEPIDDGSDSRTLFHLVEVRRATIAGSTGTLGLAGEPIAQGELCDDCWDAVAAFVSGIPSTPHVRERVLSQV